VSRIRVRLRECLDLYRARTGKQLSYAELAERAGLSRATVESLASRTDYNATLRTLEKLCLVLKVDPDELLEWRR
jgi:DNA-binding Xre family transcriptional regulator